MPHLLAVASLAAAIAATACGGGPVAAPTRPPAPPSSLPAPANSPSSIDEEVGDGLPATPAEAVDQFFRAARAGDLDRVWGLLGPRSQQQLGSRATLDAMAAELAEGWGAWAAAEARTATHVPLAEDRSVVSLTGRVTQEGVAEDRRLVLEVRRTAAGAAVEPFAPRADDPTFESPDAGADVACDAPFTVVTGTAAQVRFDIDDFGLDATLEPLDGDRTRASAALEDGMAEGAHILTAAVRDAAGRVGGAVITFSVQDGCGA